MSILVEIVCPISQKDARKTLEQHFEHANDRVLARCEYEELDRALLVVQLSPMTDESKHADFLQSALQSDIVESYGYVTSYPVSAFLNPSLDRYEQMQDFPLRYGESWLPAIDNPNKVYICLDKPFLASSQTAWLSNHQVRWEYEDS